jgi:hypothetical protein
MRILSRSAFSSLGVIASSVLSVLLCAPSPWAVAQTLVPPDTEEVIACSVLRVVVCAPSASDAVQAVVPPNRALVVPQNTALPVRFIRSVDAKKALPGDRVIAKTLQVVILLGGQRVSKGTLVVGHIVDARPYHVDREPYAHQQGSFVSIHFDQIVNEDLSLPVNLSVRVLANTLPSQLAARPHYQDETDGSGTMILIGGDEYSPFDKTILDNDGDVIGYNRREGVFARLLASDDPTPKASRNCGGTNTEQSVAIFSPSACGLYGFGNVSMTHAGRNGSGTFTLVSRGRSMKLYAGSTALLLETDVPLAQNAARSPTEVD